MMRSRAEHPSDIETIAQREADPPSIEVLLEELHEEHEGAAGAELAGDSRKPPCSWTPKITSSSQCWRSAR